jgi:BlaI family transcriptional regulator, penicillinase repressor
MSEEFPMPRSLHALSRRERQIIDVVYGRRTATAAEIVEALGDSSDDASIRKLVRILEGKGWLTHTRRGAEHVYRPTLSKHRAGKAALRHLVDTFFDGAPERAAVALLESVKDRLTTDERAQLAALIASAAKDGQ